MSSSVVSPVFVGRETESQVLANAIDATTRREASVVLIGGEAGVGKSRLLIEATARARALGIRVLIGQCLDQGGESIPLSPMVDALRSLARTTEADKLERILGSARTELARLLPELGDVPAEAGPFDGGQTSQLFELILGVLVRVCSDESVMLVIEDVHWADRSTLELLTFLTRALRDLPMVIAITFRSDEINRRHPLWGMLTNWERVPYCTQIDLHRFTREEVSAQLAAIMSVAPARDVLDQIYDRSEGNPFLVEELLGVLGPGGRSASLPASVRDLLLARTESLSPEAQQMLRTASVAGRWVNDALLESVCDLGPDLLSAVVREALDKQILVVDDDGRGYSFRHALTRDAVYGELLPGERSRLHASYAVAIQSEPALVPDPGTLSATLARHWYAAHDLPQALTASVDAAEEATKRFAPSEALAHLERAIELWPRVDDAEARAGFDLAEAKRLAAAASLRAGDAERSLAIVDEALADLGTGADPQQHALLLASRSRALGDLGRDRQSVADLQEALALLEDRPTDTRAAVLAWLASFQIRVGDIAASLETARAALEVAGRCGERRHESHAAITLGAALAYSGQVEDGLAMFKRGIDTASSIPDHFQAIRGHVNLSDSLAMLGRHREAVEVARSGIRLAESVGLAQTIGAFLTGNLVDSLCSLGEWQQAETLVTEALSTNPTGVYGATLLERSAWMSVMRGDVTSARLCSSRAKSLFVDQPNDQFGMPLAQIDAEIARIEGDLDRARRIIAESVVNADDVGSWSARYAWPVVCLGLRLEADAVEAMGRNQAPSAQAVSAAGTLGDLARDLPVGSAPARAYQATAAAELSRLTRQRDRDLWEIAATASKAANECWLAGYTSFRLAEAQLRDGDRHRAGESVHRAAQVAASLGARTLADEVSAFARRARLTTGSEPATSSGTPEHSELDRLGLTEREKEVLGLLADGRSNSQIATTLFISPKTASVHVSNILMKLGVSGRVEAAAVAHRLGAGSKKPR